MSFWNPDFSSDLQNEQKIGVITNTYHFYHLDGSKGSPPITLYYPYNMIFTNNFIFGVRLPGNAATLPEPIPFQNLTERLLSTQKENQDKINAVRDYLNNGKVTTDVSTPSGNINQKFDYNKIKNVMLNKSVRTAGILDKPKILDFGTTLEFKMGFLDTKIFIINREILDQATELLNKTPLSGKIEKF